MGTHPIFESDFDCLTDCENMVYPDANRPLYSPFFSVMGATSAMVFSAMGAAYGTAKSGVGIAAMAIMKPELIMRSVIPVVMAGIIAIYGVVVAVLITNSITSAENVMKDFVNLGAGLSVGLSGLWATQVSEEQRNNQSSLSEWFSSSFSPKSWVST